ncbi:lipoyl(octanoyl) transferase LipB [Geothrix sp. 21YS21S-4]|uniref:lipoyl(octanoyl) transferase LipB n=1 Tax=Geothrix sp. 21YS21S-4 TaxID=3068889 RepID=UPI0027B8B85D|nr:lipoyl(octanoyl) transferase LipB [Geothrix sp. 21YS21S-4]
MSDIGFSVPRPAQLRRFGRVFYAAGLGMQKTLAEHVSQDGNPDQLVILEHDPVFTLGRNATPADIHVSDDFLAAQGVGVHRTDRGGEVTYHGPGQIVAYPICNLRGGREDVGRLVRGLEEAMIRTAADFGVTADRLKGAPGIWVDTPRGPEKLGAIGLHLSRWITTHGIAFNVRPNLDHFRWITPCGFTDKGVCSLASLLGEDAPTWTEAADRLQAHLLTYLALDLQPTPPASRSVSVLTWRRGPEGPELLMMLRVPERGLWWQSVTGMLEPGETAEASAHRELQEETGLAGRLEPLDLSHSFWIDPAFGRFPDAHLLFNTETCFAAETEPGTAVRLEPAEHSEFRWCGFEEARALMPWDGSKAALRLLEERLRVSCGA